MHGSPAACGACPLAPPYLTLCHVPFRCRADLATVARAQICPFRMCCASSWICSSPRTQRASRWRVSRGPCLLKAAAAVAAAWVQPTRPSAPTLLLHAPTHPLKHPIPFACPFTHPPTSPPTPYIPADLERCGAGATVVGVLADVGAYWEYENREALMQQQQQQAASGEAGDEAFL